MALEGVDVLLVEDDPVFRQLVAAFLTNRGADVTEAEDGQTGLDKFNQARFDVVLADLSMPILGGLEMLRQMMSNGAKVPAIVISANHVMADVVEALRLGAADYLVKPVGDLYQIENAIVQCLNFNTQPDIQLADLDELSYQELEHNLSLLEQNAEAAKSVQQQLFPPSEINYPKATIDYSLFKNDNVSAYYIDSASVDDTHIVVYMAQFHPQDNRCAFASVLLKSFVDQKLRLYREGSSQSVIEPFNMLSYLNDKMSKSRLDIYIDIIYVVVELTQYRASIAKAGKGLRTYVRNQQGLMPLILADSLQLGILEWGQPSMQHRNLMPGESLCISSSHQQHKEMLLGDRFRGLEYQTQIPPGGFVQLSF
ncbi:response regulator [Shewanella waksmanii]|uniref:response regulator n=1 Tax=Shewanella waksmanii TaxID=213783 RepID=UPI00373649ED